MFSYPIAISLSPNTFKDDVLQAIKSLLSFPFWKKGKYTKKVEKWFCSYFKTDEVYTFNSGRSALYSLLEAFGIKKGDEVIIQPFTCVAVANPILWLGAKPVFVDIDDSLNIDPEKIKTAIDKKTKAIIIQHTFGTPAKIEKIRKIARENNLYLIEDCAHSLGASFQNKKLGLHSDAAFFSFGRDKVVSSVAGGAAIINSKFKSQRSKLRTIYNKIDYPSNFWILQHILHPIIFAAVLPLYNLNIGKVILVLAQKLKLLQKPVEKHEFTGKKPANYPKRFPNALSFLLIKQLSRLKEFNRKRRQCAYFYFDQLSGKKNILLPKKNKESIYLRFNILSKNADKILNNSKQNKILLGSWYKNIIDPKEVEIEKIGYKKGSCKNAERYAKLSVNLPTYPRLTIKELEKVVEILTKI